MNGEVQPTVARMPRGANKLAAIAVLLASAGAYAQEGVEQVDSSTDRVPLNTVVPDYPRVARRDRIEGEVQVCFDITRDGKPQRIAVRKSTSSLFERPARKAVRKSTWVPLKKGEEASAVKACRTFRFTLVPVPEGGERD